MAAPFQVPIPEEIRLVLLEQGVDDSRLAKWTLEAMLIEALREGIISRGKLGELLNLGFEEREQWLASRGVAYAYGNKDQEADLGVMTRRST